MSILRLEDVVKIYGDYAAVNHLSFAIPKGAVFGLLGPNGAGKTTLIRIITSIIRADTGQVWLDGEKLNTKHPGQIGYMPEERGLYKKMKVGEQLTYLARLKGLSPADTKKELRYWFERFEIKDWWDKKIEELSKGMQQKVQFIATVLHKPKLLILDEPFSGLDPINTNLIKDEIRKLNKDGTSIIFSTHRMESVEEMCEHIVLINKGKNVLEGKVTDVKEQFKDHIFKIEYAGSLPPDLAATDEANDSFEIKATTDRELKVKVAENADSNEILRHLISKGVHIRSFNEILPTINEIFIKRVGESDE
ncbi:MAG TPA: ABC transporter ATP-binding protein [Bacteroidetes bacterium]|nr:ABC transporter ATP-binding protein [Bacteroidota bacterium]